MQGPRYVSVTLKLLHTPFVICCTLDLTDTLLPERTELGAVDAISGAARAAHEAVCSAERAHEAECFPCNAFWVKERDTRSVQRSTSSARAVVNLRTPDDP